MPTLFARALARPSGIVGSVLAAAVLAAPAAAQCGDVYAGTWRNPPFGFDIYQNSTPWQFTWVSSTPRTRRPSPSTPRATSTTHRPSTQAPSASIATPPSTPTAPAAGRRGSTAACPGRRAWRLVLRRLLHGAEHRHNLQGWTDRGRLLHGPRLQRQPRRSRVGARLRHALRLHPHRDLHDHRVHRGRRRRRHLRRTGCPTGRPRGRLVRGRAEAPPSRSIAPPRRWSPSAARSPPDAHPARHRR